MEIEAGSEWFHRERLTVVEVDQVDDGFVTFMTDDMTGREHVPDFLRDYARNEPVTLELLERMGWSTADGLSLFVLDDDRGIDLQWQNGLMHVVFETYVKQPLAPVATLRDFLLTLRVFGVPCSIPEVVNA